LTAQKRHGNGTETARKRHGMERSEMERSGMGRHGRGRNGTEQYITERNETEQNITEHQHGTVRNRTEQNGPSRNIMKQYGIVSVSVLRILCPSSEYAPTDIHSLNKWSVDTPARINRTANIPVVSDIDKTSYPDVGRDTRSSRDRVRAPIYGEVVVPNSSLSPQPMP